MSLTVLQITDCHLVAAGETLIGVDTEASLRAVLEQAMERHEFQAVVASGDLAHDPQPEVYERFLDIVGQYVDVPLMCLPGNHDVLAAMESAGLPFEPLQVGDWALVPLDSHIDDTVQSEVSAADRAATAAAIEATSGRHVLVATHHPMVAIDCPWIDKDRIQNPIELLEWLSECTHATNRDVRLRGVIFGHAHQAIDEKHEDWPLLGCPSTCFQFKPRSETFALDGLSPGYRVIELSDDGSVASRVERTDFPINADLTRRKRSD